MKILKEQKANKFLKRRSKFEFEFDNDVFKSK